MKAKDFSATSTSGNNCHQQSDADARKVLQESANDASHQYEELSSKDGGFLETMGALPQPDLSKFPDGTQVLQVGPPLIIDIPDSYFGQFPNLHINNSQHKACIEEGYLSEEHRKEQLAFLNGR